MPTDVDGTFVAVGGAGLIPFLKAYEQAHGPIDGKKFIGNLFWGTPGLFEQLGNRVAGAYVGGAGTAGDLATSAAQRTTTDHRQVVQARSRRSAPLRRRRRRRSRYGYYANTWGLIKGLQAVKGDLSGGQKKLQTALGKVRLATPYGPIKLDENRQAIINVYYQQLYHKDGKLAIKTVGYIPGVDQTFGGTFSLEDAGAGPQLPAVRQAEPAVDRQDADARRSPASRDVTQADQPNSAEPILRLRGIGRRFGGLARRARRRPRRRSRRAPRDPRAERRRQDDALQRHLGRRPADLRHGRVPRAGRHAAAAPHAREARHGPHVPEVASVPRPVGRGQPLPRGARRRARATAGRSGRPAATASCASGRGELAARVGLAASARATLVGSLSHGEQRQLEVGDGAGGEPDA